MNHIELYALNWDTVGLTGQSINHSLERIHRKYNFLKETSPLGKVVNVSATVNYMIRLCIISYLIELWQSASEQSQSISK